MRRPRCVNTVDLFCGAGGASTGMELALRRLGRKHKGLAINHWSVAVDTMRRNHPDIDTKQMSIEEAVPADLVPGGEVDLLWASPSCTHHSRAKGGKPRSNQLRAQPDLILSWLDQLFVRRLIIENVPEFVEWGPLTKAGKPIERKKGACFVAWVKAIEARDYTVDWRIVNCADYGDATTRRRFFLKAVRRGCGRIRWPEPTHAEHPEADLWGRTLKPWKSVRECLDLNDLGTSIFSRPKPLAANTLRRIFSGLRKFNGLDFQMDLLDPAGKDNCRLRTLDEPAFTQPTWNRTCIVRPFIAKLRNNEGAESIDKPLSTITAGGGHHMLCQPIILDHTNNGQAHSAGKPLGTQATHDRWSLVTPLLLGQQGGAAARPIDEPCPTIATAGAIRMATPIVIDMSHPGDKNDDGRVTGGNEPLKTITTRNNSAVVNLPMLADGRLVDILIRMLKPSELAAAHSFPADYILAGNRGDQVKQIGNSVPVLTAAAMCEVDLAA
jgi:DNA (cytosine-5)-methyltransferase 1